MISAAWDYISAHPSGVASVLAFLTSFINYLRTVDVRRDVKTISVNVNGNLSRAIDSLTTLATPIVQSLPELPPDKGEFPPVVKPRKEI